MVFLNEIIYGPCNIRQGKLYDGVEVSNDCLGTWQNEWWDQHAKGYLLKCYLEYKKKIPLTYGHRTSASYFLVFLHLDSYYAVFSWDVVHEKEMPWCTRLVKRSAADVKERIHKYYAM